MVFVFGLKYVLTGVCYVCYGVGMCEDVFGACIDCCDWEVVLDGLGELFSILCVRILAL